MTKMSQVISLECFQP